jgi:hypothetical protein
MSRWATFRALLPLALLALLAGAVAVAAPTSNGRILYSDSTNTPRQRTYTASTNTFGAETATLPAGAAQTWFVDRAAPTRNEHVAGCIDPNGGVATLIIQRWNGTVWSAEWTATVGGAGTSGWRFDIAYEVSSGRCLVVYSNDTTGLNELRYRLWDGSAWTAATALDSARLTGTPNAVKLASRRTSGSNEIAATIADSNNILTTLIWSGSAWGNEPASAHGTLAGTAGENDLFDQAYESASGDLFVVFTTSAPQQNHRTYASGTWGAVTSWGTGRSAPMQMLAVANPDPTSNAILTGFNRSASANLYARVWDGATLSATTTVGSNGATPAINRRTLAGGWLTAGATTAAVLVWSSTTNTQINYAYTTNTGGAWTTSQSWTVSGSPGAKRWLNAETDPASADTLILTFSDSLNDLWAKRLVLSSGPTFTWTNADGGAALATALASVTTQNFAFAYDRPSQSLSVGNGTDPASVTIAPGGPATDLDSFTLLTSSGSSQVTALVVTLAPGTAARLALVEITSDNGLTVYGSAANPAADNLAITLGSPLTASPTLTPYRVRITALGQASLPAPPGATYTLTGTVTGVTAVPPTTYADSTSATVTLDNLSPANPSAFSGIPGDTQIALTWTNPADADFSQVVVLRKAGSGVTDTPVEGVTYSAPGTLGTSTILYVGSLQTFSDSGLTNGLAYHYRIYAKDSSGNYSATGTAVGPYTPALTTTVGNGVDPANAGLAPGGPVAALDAFTLTTSRGTDTVTSVTLSLAAGTAVGIGLVEITSDDTWTLYGAVANPASETITLALSPSIPVTQVATPYKVWITPRSHAAMPAPPGAAYAVTGTVSAIVCTNATAYADTSSATVTLDNASPAAPAWNTVTPGDSQVTLTWTNPADADLAEVLILRDTASISNRPAEGTTYATGSLLGTSLVRYVGSLQTYTDPGLTNGASYHYAICARDTSGNWSLAALTGPHVPAIAGRLEVTNPTQPAAATIPAGTAATTIGRITLSATLADVTVTELRLANTGTAVAEADVQSVQLFSETSAAFLGTAAWNGTQYVCSSFPFTLVSGASLTLAVRLNLSSGATVGNTFAMRLGPGDVAVQTPAVVNAVALCAGNTFTFTAGSAEGDPTPNSTSPTLLIVNPTNGATVSLSQTGEIRVQAHVYNPAGLSGLTAALSLNGGTSYTVALTQNANYSVGTNAGIYEARLTLSAGAYSLRARATNAAAQAVASGPVLITANPAGKGDGNLLVRDNSDQLCLDCHAIATHSSQASAKYGSWAVGCRACHTPHGTTNIYLLRTTITPPAVNGYSPAQTVKFSTTTGDSNSSAAASASFVNSDGSGPCQVCHTRTVKPGTTTKRWQRGAGTAGNADAHYTSAAGTRPCTDCHNHKNGFVASESAGGATCGGCHAGTLNLMTGAKTSKHTLGSVLGTNDDFLDNGITWANPLSGNAASTRSCVNMCHQDHLHNQPPAGTTHDYNTHQNAATSGSRLVTRNGNGSIASGTPARTDFDSTVASAGLCLSCHTNPVDASRPAVDKTAYTAAAHNYVSFSTYGAWNYTLHDGSSFDRNCTKCHWSDTAQQAAGASLGAVHGSDFPALLSGPINPNGTPATFTCNRCHGNATTGTNLSGKDLATDMAKTGGRHPVNSDNKHNLAAELAPTTLYNNGVFSGTNRHVNCLDCHSSHAAKSGVHTYSTTATSTRNLASNPLAKVSGVQFNYTGLANFVAPAAANYTWVPAATGATYEYQVCFKCHTGFTFGATPPNGLSANGTQATPPETDLAQEFNPGNKSGHPVVVALNSFTGNAAPKALTAAVMVTPWNTNVGNQTMLCSDCHNTDAASPAAQGPHGSAVPFMLRDFGVGKPLPSAWPNVTLTNRATSWCANCHTLANAVHTRSNHASTPCYGCHIVVPHGGKMSRLIGDNNSTMPTRYAYSNTLSNMRIQSFTKAAGSYSESNCQSATSGCSGNHGGAASENW